MAWYMDCEIGKVPRGWIQAVPESREAQKALEEGYIAVSDEVKALCEAHADYIWDGVTLVAPPVYVPPVPTPEQIQAQLTRALQNQLEIEARAKGYDSILSACSYEGDSNPVWSAEGTAYKARRSQVWQYGLQVMADVQNGLRPIPTEAELLAELPVFGG